MMKSRFLCLAVSRREGGYCIAGIDIDTHKWIRPVNHINHGALTVSEVLVIDHATQQQRMMAPLDLIELEFGDFVGTAGQPENWTFDSEKNKPPHLVFHSEEMASWILYFLGLIAESNNSFSQILGTVDNKVPHSTIEQNPIQHSLCLVRPKNLSWVRSRNFNNKDRIEGHFDFGIRNVRYYLPVTDVAWERKLLEQTLKAQCIDGSESPGMDQNMEILITISLGDNFIQTGFHYKLIAGVLLLRKR